MNTTMFEPDVNGEINVTYEYRCEILGMDYDCVSYHVKVMILQNNVIVSEKIFTVKENDIISYKTEFGVTTND